MACDAGTLAETPLEWSENACLTVVVASSGYPREYRNGQPIHGLDDVKTMEGVHIFHAGTKLDGDTVVAAGGRVLGVTAWAPELKDARDAAYAAIDKIDWIDGFYRKDIGWRAIGTPDT